MDKYLAQQSYYVKWKKITTEHYLSPYDHIFDIGKKNPRTTFIYIVKGEVNLHTVSSIIHGKANDLIYVPHGARYHSVWSGESGTEHYCIHAIPLDTYQPYAEPYDLQRVPSLSNIETGMCIQEIYRLFATNNENMVMQGVAKFFELYSRTLPFLQTERHTNHSTLLTKATAYIQEHYAEQFNIGKIAEALQVSESTIYHLFKNEIGTTPTKYHNHIRLEKTTLALKEDAPIEEIAYRHGFASYGYFRELFKSYTGMTPKEYRKQRYEKS